MSTTPTLLVLFIGLIVGCCLGIYEEEVGLRDWSIRNIGQLESVFDYDQDLLVQSKLLVYNQNTNNYTNSFSLALLDKNTGITKWRQLIPVQEDTFEQILINDLDKDYFITISNGNIIRYWSRVNGELIWNQVIVSTNQCYQASFVNIDTLRVLCLDSVVFLSIKRGTILSSANIDSEKNYQSIPNTFYLYYRDTDNNVQFLPINYQNSKVDTSKSKHSVSLDLAAGDQVTGHLALEGAIVYTSSANNIHVLDIQEEKNGNALNVEKQTIALFSLIKEQGISIVGVDSVYPDNRFTVVLSNKSKLLLEYTNRRLSVITMIEQHYVMVRPSLSGQQQQLFIGSNKSDGKIELALATESAKNPQPLPMGINTTVNGDIESIFSTDKQGYCLVVTNDWAIHMIQYSSRADEPPILLWTREESLSSVLASEIIDFPLPELAKLEEFEYEFNSTQGFIQHFTRRITTQIQDLVSLFMGSSTDANKDVIINQDNGNKQRTPKMILLTTLAGKVFGLSSDKGTIVWSRYYSDFDRSRAESKIFITKKTLYYPPEAAIVISTTSKSSSTKSVVSFINPLNGKESSNKIINHNILHASILPIVDDHHHQLLMIAVDYPPNQPSPMVQVYPWNEYIRHHSFASMKNIVNYYLVNHTAATVQGYRIDSMANGLKGQLKSDPTWKISFGANHQILAVGSSNAHEIIQSPAVILGNRNLLPKYVNRNVISIASLDPKLSLLTITLVDAVSGITIKSFTHAHSAAKVSIVHTENSVVYAHYDLTSHKQHISVIDMFEKTVEWTQDTYSSLSTSKQDIAANLIIKHKTFDFVQGLIKTMRLAITTKGITSKNVLVGTVSGQILPIDKKWINARRPTPEEALPTDQEEGLIPYGPRLAFPPFFYITFNTTIPALRSIETQGTDLESTSIVLAYGVDVFCTLIAPSLPYDILSDSFNHIALIITSIVLLILTFISKNWKDSLALKKKWK
ncbi:hypothetical protein CYY_000808 [Polysphondylium violaceum]|uniref:ER membrane protein complex subunit 1 n=1 Tax=Polysphondylium violaceum TaxID=133409 RepID=A0A8J4QA68_9MYCE|nr:hypothetical protein CYY_000808 [Polysphondylium violaceum]